MLQDLLSETSWRKALYKEFQKEYIKNLYQFIRSEYINNNIYPSWDNILLALNICPISQIKVVIIGQDPYHKHNQATGLAFSIPTHSTIPPSLNNIFKEIENDLKIIPNQNGDLSRWTKQGVLLLNTTLTVREHKPASHRNRGWEIFTDNIIKIISEEKDHIVFILWGKYAQTKKTLINQNKHLILESNHPSPLSAYRGFWGNKHFSQTNEYLIKHKVKPINWI
jgi:uracil-DNA glycosylase